MNTDLTTYINEARQPGKKINDDDILTYPDGTTVDMKKATEKFRTCSMYIMMNMSYFAPALKGLTGPIWTNAIDTMATDGIRLFMNPRFTMGLSDTECVFVLCHEVMHSILNHSIRAQQAGHTDHERSNIAADYEVNGILEGDGMIASGTTKKLKGYIDSKYDGWAYERIYADVGPGGGKPKQQGQPQQGNGQGKNGQGGGNNQQQHSADWIAGWNKAIAEYNAGKLKI